MSKKNSAILDLRIRNNYEISEKHQNIIKSIQDRNNKLLFVVGPPGTCKTLYSVYAALELLQRKSFKQILYLRSAIECDKTLGALPGELQDKIAPFGLPFMEKLNELISPATVNTLAEREMIDVQPINYLRGTTFNDKIVILDEAQNTSIDQLYIILSRLGEHGKLICLGDPGQIDIKDKKGFESIVNAFDSEECSKLGIQVHRLSEEDIKRSKLLRFIMTKLGEVKAILKQKS